MVVLRNCPAVWEPVIWTLGMSRALSRVWIWTSFSVAEMGKVCPSASVDVYRGLQDSCQELTLYVRSSSCCLSLFSCLVVSDSVTPRTAVSQACLSFTVSRSLLKLMFIESVMLVAPLDFSGGSEGNLPAMQETRVWSLGQEDPLEKAMVNHSNVLA